MERVINLPHRVALQIKWDILVKHCRQSLVQSQNSVNVTYYCCIIMNDFFSRIVPRLISVLVLHDKINKSKFLNSGVWIELLAASFFSPGLCCRESDKWCKGCAPPTKISCEAGSRAQCWLLAWVERSVSLTTVEQNLPAVPMGSRNLCIQLASLLIHRWRWNIRIQFFVILWNYEPPLPLHWYHQSTADTWGDGCCWVTPCKFKQFHMLNDNMFAVTWVN